MYSYYNIYHISDIYDGRSSIPVQQKKYIGLVRATEEEIAEYLKIWNKPRVYYHMYDKLYEHTIAAVRVEVKELNDLQPYNPISRDWPDIPEGVDFDYEWDETEKKWKNPWKKKLPDEELW